MTRSRQTADWGSRAGLAKIVPSSVAVGSGTGSASATGLVTVSGVSSVSLNSIFSSTYNSYCFIFNLTGSTAINLLARVRVSNTDNSSTNYAYTNWEGAFASSATDNATSWIIGPLYDSDGKRTVQNFFIKDVQSSTRYTNGKSEGVADLAAGSSVYPLVRWLGLDVTTSYDSISFIASSGTFTGTIAVYGYVE